MIIEKGLIIHIDGATEQEKKRGAEAALELFRRAEITPLQAAACAFKREGWDMNPDDPDYVMSKAESDAAHLWDEASYAAAEACCKNWADKPTRADLEVLYEDDAVKPAIRLPETG